MERTMSEVTPARQLAACLAKYEPSVAASAKGALRRLRKRLPGAVELVYDNYNALAVGFGPSERASEVIVSIALYPRWVTLFFLYGVRLPDPQQLLKGRGSRVRHIVLREPADLESPGIEALIGAAAKQSAKPIEAAQRRRLIIKSISKKQRSRRPA
jgi:hypothetical protein